MDLLSSSNKKPKSYLPHDLILPEIVARLPFENILECESVCKQWLKTIRSPPFAESHLNIQLHRFHHFIEQKYYPDRNNEITTGTKIGVLVGINDPPLEDKYSMFYKEYNDGVITTRRLNQRSLYLLSDWFIGSCHGLICIAKYAFTKETLYVFNPITREYISLPGIELPELTSYRACGFGFDAASKTYKVVRIVYPEKEETLERCGYVQVYSIGSGLGWRSKKTITRLFTSLGVGGSGVCLDNSLHWLDRAGEVWAFDLEVENFYMVTKVPDTDNGGYIYFRKKLVVLGGWLTILEFHRKSVQVWSFKRTEETNLPKSWCLEFDIEYDEEGSFTPFGLTNKGQLLCSVDHELIFLCDKVTKDMRELEETHEIYFGMLHFDSFISLEELGEMNVQKIKSCLKVEKNTQQIGEDELDAF